MRLFYKKSISLFGLSYNYNLNVDSHEISIYIKNIKSHKALNLIKLYQIVITYTHTYISLYIYTCISNVGISQK